MTTDGLLVLRRRFVLLTFLRWFPTGLLAPVLVLLLTARGLSLTTVGLVFVAYGVACLLLELPSGSLADVIGRRAVLVVSGVLFVLSAIVLAIGQTAWLLTVGMLVGGIARALDSGPLEAWYVDAVRSVDRRHDLKPGLSRAHASGALGLGLGSLASGALVALAGLPGSGGSLLLSLSVPFVVSAATAAVGLGFVIGWVREPDRAGHRPEIRKVLADVPRTVVIGSTLVTRSGVLRRLSLRVVVVGVVLVTCELLAPLQFEASIEAGGYSVLVTLAFLGAAAGARLAPALARRVQGSGRALVVATALTGLLLAGLALPGWLLPAVAYVLLYVALGLDDPLVGELLHDETSSGERATVLSVQSLLGQGGGVVMQLAVPVLVAASAFDTVWLVVAGITLVSSLLAVGLPRGVLAEPSRSTAERPPAIAP